MKLLKLCRNHWDRTVAIALPMWLMTLKRSKTIFSTTSGTRARVAGM